MDGRDEGTWVGAWGRRGMSLAILSEVAVLFITTITALYYMYDVPVPVHAYSTCTLQRHRGVQ